MPEAISMTDAIGYFASISVLVSYIMKDMKWLRTLSIFGCSLFVVYGVLLSYSFPIIITNAAIIIINFYYLLRKKD